MSGFLVDTNVLSEFSRRGEPDHRVRSWLTSASPTSLHVNILTLAEIRRGIELLAHGKRRTQLEQWLEIELLGSFVDANVLPVTKPIGYLWAALSARRQAQGRPLPTLDGLIAATALHHNLTLATRNGKDFVGLGVTIINPWGEIAKD